MSKWSNTLRKVCIHLQCVCVCVCMCVCVCVCVCVCACACACVSALRKTVWCLRVDCASAFVLWWKMIERNERGRERKKEKKKYRKREREVGRRQIDRQPDRQTDRQTEKQRQIKYISKTHFSYTRNRNKSEMLLLSWKENEKDVITCWSR